MGKVSERGRGIAYVLFYFMEGTDASHNYFYTVMFFFRSRPIGSDIEAGELVLNPGTLLGAAEVGVLAAVGATVVTVSSLPRVAVLSTGEGGGASCPPLTPLSSQSLPFPASPSYQQVGQGGRRSQRFLKNETLVSRFSLFWTKQSVPYKIQEKTTLVN
jgi:hypothetical protein